MARKPAKGEFTPVNPSKYVGTMPITYRSSWEISMMMWLDKHPYVLAWASESISIPYYNPVKQAWSVYIPDFFLVYADGTGNGAKHCEIVEVKPQKEIPGYVNPINERTGKQAKLSQVTQLAQAVNLAKWHAAEAYCKKRGWRFRIVDERTLYNYK